MDYFTDTRFDPKSVLKFVDVWWKHLWIFHEHLWQSSGILMVIFENFRKLSSGLQTIFGESLEGGRKSLENGQKHYYYVYIINKVIHGCLWIWNISSHVLHLLAVLACEIASWTIKDIFIPTCTHVLSSLYCTRHYTLWCCGYTGVVSVGSVKVGVCTTPFPGSLISLVPGGKMRDPGNELGVCVWHSTIQVHVLLFFGGWGVGDFTALAKIPA